MLISPPEGHKSAWKIGNQTFDVNSKTVSMILNDMFETKLGGNEHGFLMCETEEGVIPGQHCHGNACSVHITDCKGLGHTTGSFHSHPEVISFSLSDYIHAIARANENPDKKGLLCVGLGDKGIRCKAIEEMPPVELAQQLSVMPDNDTTRGMIKPFFTKRVNISVEQLKKLKDGVPWDELPPAEEVIAIDEGEDVCAPSGKQCLANPMHDLPLNLWKQGQESQGGQPMAKTLIQIAQEYIKEPSGKYPWEIKQVTKSVKTEMGIGLEAAGMPKLENEETQFIPTKDIEIPDPSMLAYGEVAQYISAFSPIILTKEKDKNGRWKILDGRHRLAGLRASGYKTVPVVFAKTAVDYE